MKKKGAKARKRLLVGGVVVAVVAAGTPKNGTKAFW